MEWSGNNYKLSQIVKKIFADLFVDGGAVCEPQRNIFPFNHGYGILGLMAQNHVPEWCCVR